MSKRVGLAVLAVAACAAVTGCAATNGPLEGPRAEPGSVEICSPAGSDRDVYFGETFTNVGTDPVEIHSVEGAGSHLAQVEYTVDLEGPALDQNVGGLVWPTDEPYGYEQQLLDRMVPAEGAVIAPGASATLLMRIEPASATDPAVLAPTTVNYVSRGRVYREANHVTYRLAPGEAC